MARQARLARKARLARPARRRVLLSAGGVLLVGSVLTGCGGTEGTSASRTIPAACLPYTPATAPPGTDVTGSSVPGTVPAGKPTPSVPPAPVSELQKTDLRVGTGAEVTANDQVIIQYVGVACSTGTEFDSSWERGDATTPYPVSNFVPGFRDGLIGMKVGGQRQLVIPPDQAYGADPDPQSGIAKNETLVFVIDLLSTEPVPATTTTAAPAETPGSTDTSAPGTTAAP